jgi:hypothetical protein
MAPQRENGACQPSGLDTANWYVGYVEKADAVSYFALEIGAKDYGRRFRSGSRLVARS